MFQFVLALAVLVSNPPQSEQEQPKLWGHNAVVKHYCKAGVPVITARVVVEKENLLTTACSPKTGQFALIIICNAEGCTILEDRNLPAQGFEKVLRSKESPGLGI